MEFFHYVFLAVVIFAANRLSTAAQALHVQGFFNAKKNFTLLGLSCLLAFALFGTAGSVATLFAMGSVLVLAGVARRERKSMVAVVKERALAAFN